MTSISWDSPKTSIDSLTVSRSSFSNFWSRWTVNFTCHFWTSHWRRFRTWASHLWFRNRSNFTAGKIRSWCFRFWHRFIENIGNSFLSCLLKLWCFRIIYNNFIVLAGTYAIGLFLSQNMSTKHQTCTNKDWCSSKRIFTYWVTLTFLKNICLSLFDHSHFLGCLIKK